MKKLNHLTLIAKVFAVSLLLLAVQQSLMSQITPVPLSGSIYGEPVISASYHNGLRYVTTASSIYACGGDENNYYRKVWSAPTGFSIVASNVVHYYTGDFHTILLSDGASSNYVSLSKINASGPDDNGSSPVPMPSFFVPFVKIAGTANALYALTHLVGCGIEGSLYVSYDQGQTWNQDTAGVEWSQVYDFALDSTGNLYTVSDMGVYKQLAGDSTATQVNVDSNFLFVTNIFVDRQNRIIVGANSITYSPTDAAYISTDGGNTFSTNATLAGNFNAYADDAFGNLYALGTDSINESMLVCINAAGTCTHVNTNINNVIPPSSLFTLSFGSSPIICFNGDSVLLIGTNQGLFSSADQGSTWVATNQGIFAENIYSIIQQPFGRLLCTTDIGVFYKDDADTVWHQTNMTDGSSPGTYLYNDNAGNIFAQQKATGSYPPDPLAKSTDNGFSWSVENAGFETILGASFYLDEAGAQHFYSTYQVSNRPLTIWTQNPGDSAWRVDTAGLPVVNTAIGVNTVCSDKQGYLYADLNAGSGSYLMYRRTLNSNQWVIDTAGLSTDQNIISMASNPSFGIIAVSGGSTMNYVSGLFRRTSTGWVKIPTRKDSINITAVSVDANGVIFAAELGPQSDTVNIPQTNAVYYTSDMGNTWSQALLTNMNVLGTTSNFINQAVPGGLISNGNITYALTKGHGGFVFTSQNTTTGISIKAEVLNSGIQAFPNPSSTGSWTLQATEEMEGGNVELSDMNGRIIYRAVLTSTELQINPTEIAQGVYLLNVRKGEKSSSTLVMKQ